MNLPWRRRQDLHSSTVRSTFKRSTLDVRSILLLDGLDIFPRREGFNAHKLYTKLWFSRWIRPRWQHPLVGRLESRNFQMFSPFSLHCEIDVSSFQNDGVSSVVDVGRQIWSWDTIKIVPDRSREVDDRDVSRAFHVHRTFRNCHDDETFRIRLETYVSNAIKFLI